jgi:hypothetical protein
MSFIEIVSVSQERVLWVKLTIISSCQGKSWKKYQHERPTNVHELNKRLSCHMLLMTQSVYQHERPSNVHESYITISTLFIPAIEHVPYFLQTKVHQFQLIDDNDVKIYPQNNT